MRDKYNDEEIKKMLQSENVPEELEPENVKIMLDKFAGEKRRKRIIKHRAFKIIPVAAAFVLTFGIASSFYLKNPANFDTDKEPENIVDYALEYQEVYDYFNLSELSFSFKDWLFGGTSKSAVVYEEAEEDMAPIVGEENGVGDSGVSSLNAQGTENTDYSDTYNQEEGVLEADIVKTDGSKIYYASDNVINIAQIENGDFMDTSQISLKSSEYIEDLYLYNNYLIVISTIYDDCSDYYDSECRMYGNGNTKISIYLPDNNMSLAGSYVQEGYYNDVRLTSDGYLYLISNDEKYFDNIEFSADDIKYYIPKYSVNDDEEYVDSKCIVIPECVPDRQYSYAAYTNISGFDLNSSTPYSPSDIKSIAGYSNNIYCSTDNLYVTWGYDKTEITRFAISEGKISPEASGTIDGYVNDQFSMSEYDGYFRIAVTIENWQESEVYFEDSDVVSNTGIDETNCLYVMDMNLSVVGQVSGFGDDESIKSVNFNENMAYVVTYMQTDPLFAIDLSNPENPVILDEFKINGYSTYMQKWSDSLLLGFGVNADENGFETGIKLTMFDNSDPENLNAVSTAEINGSGYDNYVSSEAVWERKALLIDNGINIIGVPVTEYSETAKNYYIFYSFENNQLVFKGKIYSYDSGQDFNRAVIIGDYVYMLSGTQITSADIESFTVTKTASFD
ncbi:beta-propeller domain-containing protein [Porcipelethomonas sp.]|uniref:beta-propeller domain-containing protein n=1 Tax=Porcipelethomonas sp. TaxID=2981675 RepID=UPI003EF77059